ncbi:MAG TPA: ABC transporter permease [Bacilli bacterium]|nr:ABC transporter permease [Bacilli bacterium]
MSQEKQKVTKKDFVLVQQDKAIYDLKFETKPTTYLKDAMRRFVKNKSSVSASVIIGILILLAIFVPIFNKSNIDMAQTEFRFLPPRWPGFTNSNVLNGTREYKDIVTDVSDPENPLPVGFKPNAIVSEIKTTETKTSSSSEYAYGGLVKVASDRADRDLYWHYANFVEVASFDPQDDADYVITINLPEANNVDGYYEVYASFIFKDDDIPLTQEEHNNNPDETVYLPIIEKTNNYGITTVSLSDVVMAEIDANDLAKTVYAKIGVKVFKDVREEKRQDVYIKELSVTNKAANGAEDTTFSEHNFDEGNELLLRRIDDEKNLRKKYEYKIARGSVGRYSLFEATIVRSSFTYDPYEAVYGPVHKVVPKDELDLWVELGYIEYTTTEYIENGRRMLDVQFNNLSDKSPVIEIINGEVIGALGKTATEFVMIVSGYRYQGLDAVPYYIFGTNQKGHDYFKVIFSGLRTSLILGISAAAINILIGLVWGAVSGYYGGTVDLVMERFTEILGGIPWIIIMTLAILHLGNSFEVFLLALILTGWIGIAATTRSQFYRYKRREYVLASRTLGASDRRLIFKHILPNSIGPIVTGAVLMIPGIIFSEATISYLGLGLQGLHSMGVALSEVQEYIYTSPFLIVSGSIVIALLLISFNLFGNGLRDAFNPSLKGSE